MIGDSPTRTDHLAALKSVPGRPVSSPEASSPRRRSLTIESPSSAAIAAVSTVPRAVSYTHLTLPTICSV